MTERLIKNLTGWIVSAVLICTMPIYAADNTLANQNHTEKEIRGLVAAVQLRLDNLKKNMAAEIAEKDIKLIERSLATTNNLLEQKQIDDAFYQIEIARAIFEIVDARFELYNSKKILEQLKTQKATAR